MGLTLRGKCSRRCEQGRKGLSCSCPKSWSYYVEFFVREEGNRRTLSVKGPGAKLKRWRVGCANKGLAREQESIIKAQLLKGQPIVTLNQVPLTFIQYAEGWLVESKSSLAVKTHANYTQLLSLYILPSLGNRELASVKWVDVRALLNEKQQAGLSVNTVRLIRAVTSTILTDAAEEGHIPANPLLGNGASDELVKRKPPMSAQWTGSRSGCLLSRLGEWRPTKGLELLMQCSFAPVSRLDFDQAKRGH